MRTAHIPHTTIARRLDATMPRPTAPSSSHEEHTDARNRARVSRTFNAMTLVEPIGRDRVLGRVDRAAMRGTITVANGARTEVAQ